MPCKGLPLLRNKQIGGVSFAWDAMTRRDEKFDSKWLEVRRKPQTTEASKIKEYKRSESNLECTYIHLYTSYMIFQRISIKNCKDFGRIFENNGV